VYANHLKVLRSKVTVLSVQAKGVRKDHQVSARELNESEPFEDMSKQHLVVKSTDFQQLVRGLWRASVYWPQSSRH
jgi:nitrogen regulatory protein PII